jgi:hypothetical protein
MVFLSPKLVCDALDRASPDAERLGHLQDTQHRVLQWPDARRASQRKSVHRSRLQHREATLLARLPNSCRLCRYTHRAEGRNIARALTAAG